MYDTIGRRTSESSRYIYFRIVYDFYYSRQYIYYKMDIPYLKVVPNHTGNNLKYFFVVYSHFAHLDMILKLEHS